MYILEEKDWDWAFRVTCSLCRSAVSIGQIKQDYKKGWKWGKVDGFPEVFCGYCTHRIEDKHTPKEEGSSMCKCGATV